MSFQFRNENTATSPHLLLLPNEIIVHILNYCCYKSISALNQTCTKLQKITNQESVWSFLCCKDYGVKNKGSSFDSFDELYKKFLCRYGNMLGTYMVDLPHYGGLAEIEFRDGLAVWQWKQSLALPEKPLRKVALFRIEKPSQKGEASVLCCRSKEPHEAMLVKNGRRFALKCNYPGLHRMDELETSTSDMFYTCGILDGLTFLPLKLHHLDIPGVLLTEMGGLPESLIEPGLFRGVSDALEDNFVLFQYRWDGTLLGFRVASDSFAATENSIKVNLKRSFCPSPEQQSSIEALKSVSDELNLDETCECLILPQFKVKEKMKPALQRCKSRFHGFGKLRRDGFQKIHFVVFSNNTVGVLWVEMCILRIFERITQRFTEKRGDNCIFINT